MAIGFTIDDDPSSMEGANGDEEDDRPSEGNVDEGARWVLQLKQLVTATALLPCKHESQSPCFGIVA